MTFEWIKSVNQSGASTGARALALCLLQFMDAQGVCWPSQELLAETVNASDRTIRRWMCELEDLGLIVRKRSTIRALTGHQWPQTGHPRPVQAEPNRTPVATNRTPTSGPSGTEPDTSGHKPDTDDQRPDTSGLTNYPLELTNRTIQSARSDDGTDEQAFYLLAVFHEYRKHQITPDQCIALIGDAADLGATMHELEDEVRTICEKLRHAGAWQILKFVRENLEAKSEQRLQKRAHLQVGRNNYAPSPEPEPEPTIEEQLRHVPY